MLFSKKKMPISIRFRLNQQGSAPHLVQYLITVNGKEATKRLGLVLDTGEFVKLHPKEWDQKGQRARGNSEDAMRVNEAIQALKARLNACYRQQEEPYRRAQKAVEQGEAPALTHPAPLPDSVLFRHLKGQAPWVVASVNSMGVAWAYEPPKETDPQLVTLDTDVNQAMRLYIISMRVNGRRMPTGRVEQPGELLLTRFEATADLLAQYQPKPLAVGQLTAMWADNFHAWLQTQRSGSHRPDQAYISFGLASRHAGRLRELVSWLHRQKGVLRHNPLAGVKWKGYDRKPIEALDEEQFAGLASLPATGTNAIVQWWFLLMCYTGMDYPDAKAYATNRTGYEVMTPDGLTIQGIRKKNGESYCIPFLSPVEVLFSQHPTGPYQLSPQKLNLRLQHFFAEQIGFSAGLTAKIARKTHTNLLEGLGYTVNETSRSLGHSSVSTTQKFYYRTGVRTIRQGMRRLANEQGKKE